MRCAKCGNKYEGPMPEDWRSALIFHGYELEYDEYEGMPFNRLPTAKQIILCPGCLAELLPQDRHHN